jgi:hypothetical protein
MAQRLDIVRGYRHNVGIIPTDAETQHTPRSPQSLAKVKREIGYLQVNVAPVALGDKQAVLVVAAVTRK